MHKIGVSNITPFNISNADYLYIFFTLLVLFFGTYFSGRS